MTSFRIKFCDKIIFILTFGRRKSGRIAEIFNSFENISGAFDLLFLFDLWRTKNGILKSCDFRKSKWPPPLDRKKKIVKFKTIIPALSNSSIEFNFNEDVGDSARLPYVFKEV